MIKAFKIHFGILGLFVGSIFIFSFLPINFVHAIPVTAVVPAICGNGEIEDEEECDDGNVVDEDGCSSSCIEDSGDGGNPIVTPPPDDPPPDDPPSDPTPPGTPPAVSLEGGTGGGSNGGGGSGGGGSTSTCGNGIVEGREECDDGNRENGDGCSIICRKGTTLGSIQESISDIGEIIKTGDSVVEKTLKVTETVVEQLSEVILPAVKEQIKVVVDNPTIEEVTKKVVAPAAVITSAAVVVPSVWSVVFPLLRFLFLQPILVFGKRKRTKWGVVYDSLSKNPVDLAMVRLIDKANNRIVQSRVTDKDGRFLFVIDPGEYIIEVNKQGFIFPSNFLKGEKIDGTKLDLYHGGTIVVSNEQTAITPNIPLDPAKVEVAPWKFRLKRRFRLIQHIVSIFGIFATAAAVYISPTWYIILFLVIHVVIYLLFLFYARPKKTKGWGIVRQQKTNRPLKKVIARLFSKQYNKLIATEITGSKGQYAFLVGPSDYYVTFQKKGYKEEVLDVNVEEEGDVIKEDVMLKKDKNTGLKSEQDVENKIAEKNSLQKEDKDNKIDESVLAKDNKKDF